MYDCTIYLILHLSRITSVVQSIIFCKVSYFKISYFVSKYRRDFPLDFGLGFLHITAVVDDAAQLQATTAPRRVVWITAAVFLVSVKLRNTLRRSAPSLFESELWDD